MCRFVFLRIIIIIVIIISSSICSSSSSSSGLYTVVLLSTDHRVAVMQYYSLLPPHELKEEVEAPCVITWLRPVDMHVSFYVLIWSSYGVTGKKPCSCKTRVFFWNVFLLHNSVSCY